MRLIAIPLSITALFASLAFGQTPADQNLNRVFHFTHGETGLEIQEIATLLGGIAAVRQTSSDAAQRTLEVRGTAGRIALAEWLCGELDNPTHGEYRVPGGEDDVVQVFYLPYAPTMQTFQEVATMVRSIAEIRQMFTINEPRALAVRGTSSQVALAAWLFGEMDKPTAPFEYRMPGGGDDDVVRVFHLPHTPTIQDFQQIAILVRSTAEIRRVFTYNESRALAARGSAAQMALAEWLFNELDNPTLPHEYPIPGKADEQVRVFYLAHAGTPKALQEIAAQIRSTANMRWVFPYDRQRAIAVRADTNRIALAEKLVQESDK